MNPTSLPDVLNMITGGVHAAADVVQFAFAIHPDTITVGQALEGLLLVQNNCDKAIPVRVTLRLPRKDLAGNLMSIVAAKEVIDITMQPGEAGLLHIPIAAYPPTQPNEGSSIGVRVETRPPKGYNLVRPPEGGRFPSMLNLSPYRLSILKSAGFAAVEEEGFVTRPFEIMTGHINAPAPALASRYETIWSLKELPQEQARHAQMAEKAQRLARTLHHAQALPHLIRLSEKRFSEAGLALQPAEAMFMAKLMAYTLEDGLEAQGVCSIPESTWFQHLIAIIEDEVLVRDVPRILEQLFSAILKDAVRLGLVAVEKITGENFGTPADHRVYAQDLVRALESKHNLDLSSVYLPLVLAGVVLNFDIKVPGENLWANLAAAREAWKARMKQAATEFGDWVTRVLSEIVYEAEQLLIENKVPKK